MRGFGYLIMVGSLVSNSLVAAAQPGSGRGRSGGHGPHHGMRHGSNHAVSDDCACAKHPDGMGPGMGSPMDDEGDVPGRGGRGMLGQLDLSKDQREKMKVIRDDRKPRMQMAREQVQTAHDEMKSLFDSGAATEQLRAQHRKIQSAMAALMDQRFEMILAIYDILTPEQKHKWRSNMPRGFGKHGS